MQKRNIQNHKIGILGLGNMGGAIAQALLEKFKELRLYAYDHIQPVPEMFSDRLQLCDSIRSLEESADLILICIKPAQWPNAAQNLSGEGQYISIMAGVSTEQIQKPFYRKGGGPGNPGPTVARVMPNILAQTGDCISGVYCAEPQLKTLTMELFGSIGFATSVESEQLLHAITGLSGSGPAFVFAFVQALAEGGVLAGLSYATALELAARTVRGSAQMLLETQQHPGVLRNQVTSAGGTTITGLGVLEESGFGGTVMKAVQEAAIRSREIAEETE